MQKIVSPYLVLVFALAACSPAATQPAATSSPFPTATQPPTQTPFVITATTESAPTAEGSALEAILLTSPGLGSRVSSPAAVQGQSRPTFEQNLVVAIYGENGEELALVPTTIQAPSPEPGPFSVELTFAVSTEQPGRISVFETSAMDGGIIHLSSVEVTLLPGGAVELLPEEIHFESIFIDSPAPLAEISGGVITITGFSDYYFESNLGLMLCGEGGSGAPNDLCGTEDNILAVGNALIDAPEMGQPGPFSGQLSYSVSGPTHARIVVFAASPRDGGLLHVSSIPIVLMP
ncbi:MAG: Gmad2 immunoglobulin-like domain-containing protein [Anaerolineales bacterium]